MKPKNYAKIGLAACVALPLALLRPAWAVERQTLNGHIPAVAARLQPVERLPGSSRLNLALGLPLRNQEGLTALLEQLYDPASPRYRRYLTPEQFAERFGPAKKDYETLISFAKTQGLAVTATHPNRTLLDVNGTVEDIERAFRVTLRVYQHPTEARTFYAPDVEPSLDLAVPVLHIGGLDNFHRPRPAGHKRPPDPNRTPKPMVGSGPGGGFMGTDFRAAYVPGVTLTGAGQSVALFALDGYYASDIRSYESLTGLPDVPLRNVLIGGFDGSAGANNVETAMDIEMAIAMAPGLSQVIVYEGGGGTDYDILNRIATDNAAKQISSSWILPFDATTDQVFQQYAAQGQSFFIASGDWEAYPGVWVADGPLVTVVGGTELSTGGPGGAWVSETVWNLGYFPTGSCLGSGGGISATYPIPSWQEGVSMAANKGSTAWRNSPDVAMVADNIWALANNGYALGAYGTSASSPLWAGLTALANQLAEAHGQPPVGFINPAIYRLGKGPSYQSVFHDITTGNNNSSEGHNGYPAVPGYDLCTGWGTPNGSNLLYALALPQPLQIMPGTNLFASGPPGGPFSPMMQYYSLTNFGTAPLDWALAYSASWLDASASGGTIAPGDAAATVTLSLNSAANNLPGGNYSNTIWFTNLNDGSVQSRFFTLAVATAPMIVAGPVDLAVPEGSTATFTVSVIPGSGSLSYQWARATMPLTDDGRIIGAATDVLTLHDVTAADSGAYSVVVSNSSGSVANAGSILAVFPVTASGITLTTLYSFKNANDGANPNGLVLATNGLLYGTANVGPSGAGTVFRITTNGVLSTLHAFTGGNDGGPPRAALIQASDGNLYGTTVSGGANYGGTAFRLSLNGALSTLHAFGAANDGVNPIDNLLQATDGNIYGTTYGGGDSYNGTVFRLAPNASFTTLHSFAGADGANPPAGLVQGKDGDFYGVTMNGGADPQAGTVFKITTAGTLSTLFKFDRTGGWFPNAGLIQGKDGSFYGATINGGAYGHGTAFKITPARGLTTLHSFNGTGDGEWPDRALLEGRDGYFYGNTSYGGIYGGGTLFRMSPSGVLTTLVQFDGFNGANPSASLVQAIDGSFYGTTLNGGAYGDGTVFRLTVQAPSLSISLSGGSLALSWPSWAADFVLQKNSDLTSTNWTAVTNAAVVTNLQNQLMLSPAPSGSTFYRLAR